VAAQAAYDAARGDIPTPTKEELAESGERIRREGYSSSAGMLNRNFAAIAAPIFDHSGKIAATITLLGPTDFMSKARLKDFSKMLLASTQAVSERMGALPKPAEKPAKG